MSGFEKLSRARSLTARYLRGGLAWLKEWVRPLDPISSSCGEGHPQLRGWARCPYCRVNQVLREVPPQVGSGTPRLSLVRADRLSQPVPLREGTTRFGNTPDCDTWLPGEVLRPIGPIQFDVNGRVKCTPLAGSILEVNGRKVSEAFLYDGDEVRVDAVPFLAVALPSSEERSSYVVH